MTKKQLEWFVIIGNIFAIILAIVCKSLSVYLSVACVPNGSYLGLLICEHIDKRVEKNKKVEKTKKS